VPEPGTARSSRSCSQRSASRAARAIRLRDEEARRLRTGGVRGCRERCRAEPDGDRSDHGRPEGPSAVGQLVRGRTARLYPGRVLRLGHGTHDRLAGSRALHDAHHRHAPDRPGRLQRHRDHGLGERHGAVRDPRGFDRGARPPDAAGLCVRARLRTGGRDLLHSAHAAGVGSGALRRAHIDQRLEPPGRRLLVRHVRADRTGAEVADECGRDGRARRAAHRRCGSIAVGEPALPATPRRCRARASSASS
jgi:hypothetical protein